MANTNTLTTNYSLPVPELGNAVTYDIPRIKSALTTVDATLFAKQDTLVSAVNVKTVNGNSLLGSGDITISGSGGGSGLTPTTIKTANYTAATADLVRCNSAAGIFSITLPASPADGAIVAILDIGNTFGTNNVTVLPNTGKTIESDTSLILDITGTYVSFVYNLSATNWRLLETPSVPLASNTALVNTGSVTNINGILSGDGSTLTGITLKTINGNALTGSGNITVTVADGALGTPVSGILTNCTGYTYANLSGTIPTWNQNTTGTASNVTSTVSIANGGTGATSAIAALTALGAQAALVSGTSIKTVNGTTLLGSGDLVITGGASATKTIANKTASYTVIASDLGTIINCTSGTFTVSLTAAATLGSGFNCTIWNTGTGQITIDPNAAETIDGVTTLILRQGEGTDIVCNGTNWETSYKKTMRGYAENYLSTSTRPVATTGNNAIAIGNSYASGTNSFAAAIANNTSGFGATGANSIAIGQSASASGIASYALGRNSTCSANYGTAIGNSALATTNDGATAIGINATATGANSVSLGQAYASGTDSFAAAVVNNTSSYGATSANSIAIGKLAKATGSGSVALGKSASATGGSSIAIGGNGTSFASATGVGAIAIGGGYGTNATAAGQGSIAIGDGNSTGTHWQAAIGYNSNGLGSVAYTGQGAIALSGSYANGADSFAAAVANNTSTYGALGTNSIAIGLNNKSSGAYSVSLGAAGLASGDSSIALGSSVTATGVNSVVLGNNAVSTQNGKYTFANGRFLANGDAQFGKIVLRAQNSSTATILTSDGAAASTTNQLIVATGQSMAIQGTLIAKQSGNGNITAYNITGAVSNNGGTLSSTGLALTLIGTDSIGLGAAPTIALDTVNKAVKITSGWTGAQTRYVATLNTTEVTFA